MRKAISRLLPTLLITFFVLALQAQPSGKIPEKVEAKPYKVLTNGKRITIKSTSNLKQVMLWTNAGNRLVEQRDINASGFTFTIPIKGNYFFLMVQLTNGKIYTEKIGVQ